MSEEHEHEHEQEDDDLDMAVGICRTLSRRREGGHEVFVVDFGHGPRRFKSIEVDEEKRPWAR